MSHAMQARLTEAADFLDHLYAGVRHVPTDLLHEPGHRGLVTTLESGRSFRSSAALFYFGGAPEVFIALGPACLPMLSRWLRTEIQGWNWDEDHEASDCTTENCTVLAALELADHILKQKEKGNPA